MTLQSVLATIRSDILYFGIRRTIYDVFLRVVNHFMFFKVLRIVAVKDLMLGDPLPPTCRFRRIPLDELRSLARQPEYAIDPLLLDEVRTGHNNCFGIYDGSTLVNYLFMFVTPNSMTDDLEVSFGPQYVYLCSTFTHPDHRGRRFNSIGAGLAAREYLNKGFAGLLAYVEANNFGSLKSLYRIGFRRIGTIHIARAFGRYFIHTGGHCARYSFRVAPKTSDPRLAKANAPGS